MNCACNLRGNLPRTKPGQNLHLCTMATTLIQVKRPLKSSQKSKGQWVWDMAYSIGNVGSNNFTPMIIWVD